MSQHNESHWKLAHALGMSPQECPEILLERVREEHKELQALRRAAAVLRGDAPRGETREQELCRLIDATADESDADRREAAELRAATQDLERQRDAAAAELNDIQCIAAQALRCEVPQTGAQPALVLVRRLIDQTVLHFADALKAGQRIGGGAWDFDALVHVAEQRIIELDSQADGFRQSREQCRALAAELAKAERARDGWRGRALTAEVSTVGVRIGTHGNRCPGCAECREPTRCGAHRADESDPCANLTPCEKHPNPGHPAWERRCGGSGWVASNEVVKEATPVAIDLPLGWREALGRLAFETHTPGCIWGAYDDATKERYRRVAEAVAGVAQAALAQERDEARLALEDLRVQASRLDEIPLGAERDHIVARRAEHLASVARSLSATAVPRPDPEIPLTAMRRELEAVDAKAAPFVALVRDMAGLHPPVAYNPWTTTVRRLIEQARALTGWRGDTAEGSSVAVDETAAARSPEKPYA